MIQRGEVLDDIHAQHVAIAPGELLQPVDGPVRAFADPVGVAVGDEARLEQRLDDVAQRMVHHPIAKGRGADLAAFRLVDGKVGVRAGAVGLGAQLGLELDQPVGGLDSKRATLAVPRLPLAALR